MKLQIFKYLENTKVEGPRQRFCIWVQGCKKHCKGCFAKHSWDFNGGYSIDTKVLIEKIKAQKEIEGVTFLGGEPFLQAPALYEIAKFAKKEGLGIVCFTGYNYKELKKSKNVNVINLLNSIDLLIDGEYIDEKHDITRPWVGSSNQNYIFLTNRYDKNILSTKNKIEVRINKNGSFFINGMGDFKKIEANLIDKTAKKI